jgi:hypothetical protein
VPGLTLVVITNKIVLYSHSIMEMKWAFDILVLKDLRTFGILIQASLTEQIFLKSF